MTVQSWSYYITILEEYKIGSGKLPQVQKKYSSRDNLTLEIHVFNDYGASLKCKVEVMQKDSHTR